jgi:hypothetical protein
MCCVVLSCICCLVLSCIALCCTVLYTFSYLLVRSIVYVQSVSAFKRNSRVDPSGKIKTSRSDVRLSYCYY